MDVIIVMCIGVLAGKKLFPRKWKHINEFLQTICTVLLIFSMGVLLGSRDNFVNELRSLGFRSFLCFLIPSVFSVLAVYALTRRFPEKKQRMEKEKE